MFQLTKNIIEADRLQAQLQSREAGAFASFAGIIRNNNDGKQVLSLTYEAYEILAEKEGSKIIAEAQQKWPLLQVIAVHRYGHLNIGETAVWIGVLSAHRNEAFAACRYIIDEIKQRLPIWKKEEYVDGNSTWVDCHNHQPAEKDLYLRQVCLPEVGKAGQEKLKNSKVLVVGAGGLGAACLQYLAGAGIGQIGICDYDLLEASNLHRQPLYSAADIGKSKADLAAIRLQNNNPFLKTTVHNFALDKDNAADLLSAYDLVIDCTDNFAAKFLLFDAACRVEIPLIQASIYQYEGQMHMFDPTNKQGQCLHCLLGDASAAACAQSCSQSGVIGAVAGTFGSLQAMEAIKYILDLPTALNEHILIFNLLDYELSKIKVARDAKCLFCGSTNTAKNKRTAVAVCAVNNNESNSTDWELDILDLSQADLAQYQLVDIREREEDKEAILKGLLRIPCLDMPLSSIDKSLFSKDKKYLIICQKGMRSHKFVSSMREEGHNNFFSLQGGIESVRRKYMAG